MPDSISQIATASSPGQRPDLANSWLQRIGVRALLFASLVASALVRENDTGSLIEAVIWLPSGVAIAGLWLLGLGSWWIVALAAIAVRVWIGYPATVIVSGGLGSACEAACGAWLLRRMNVEGAFARLRDVVALCVVASVAPLASILVSWIGRACTQPVFRPPFYSGWDGWWRMNALGVLVVLPFISTWFVQRPSNWSRRASIEALAIVLGLLAVVWLVMTRVEPDPLATSVLYSLLPIALFAAVRFGPRGAISIGALTALSVALGTNFGIGPFMSVPLESRHVAVQVFDLSLVGVPLVLGALIAEREAAIASQARASASRRAFQQLLLDVTYRIKGDGTVLDMYVPEGLRATKEHERWIGKRVAEVVAPELARKLEASIEETLRGAPTEPHEFQFVLAGSTRIHEARFVRIATDEVLSLVRDITERKRDELLLSWQARVLEAIATGRPTVEVMSMLLHGIESMTEGGLASLLTLEGQRLKNGIAPSLPASYTAALEGLVIGPAVGSCGTAAFTGQTTVVSDIENDPLWTEFAALALSHGLRSCWSVPVRAADGRVLGTFAVYYRERRAPSASELKLVERAAALAGITLEREQRESLLASINHNVNEGILRTTPDRGLLYVNDAMARMFGFDSAEQLVRTDPKQLFVDPERRVELFRVLRERGRIDNEEVLCRRRDGTTFWGMVQGRAVFTADGRIDHCDGAIADITERKGLEDKLRQAQKMEAVGRLAGGVAHDFNNLLTAISGYAESLVDSLPGASRELRDAQEILRAAGRAAGLTRQLLAYSRQQVLAPRVLDLTAIVDELGDMLRRLIGEHIRLSIPLAAQAAHARVDRGQIEQVVLNLVLNARDAMPAGGTLTIETTLVELDANFLRGHAERAPGPYVCMSVSDTGCGMDEATRSRAFDPFFTTKVQGKGTGLGLSTVYGIVHQSGGLVTLASTLGVGTTVSVYLPRLANAAPTTDEARPAPVSTRKGGTVLVVEDEPMVREIMTTTLRAAGFLVLEAENGERALDVARAASRPPDLVVTDLIMPRTGGFELARELRRQSPRLPVLFVSGYTAEAPLLPSDPSTSRLQKPFTRKELLARVSALLEDASSG